jgi:hypothetical protein
MKMHISIAAIAAAAFVGFTGAAIAEPSINSIQVPGDNYAAKPGCSLYGPCSRVDQNIRPYGLTTSAPNGAASTQVGMMEVLGNGGYRYGYGVFNVIDTIR